MRALLSSVSEIEVAGIATNGDEVMSLAASLLPDVILMDLQMPGIGGIEATRRILHTSPHIRVLVVTMFEDNHSVFAALRVGARGYILVSEGWNAQPASLSHFVNGIGFLMLTR